MELNRKQKPRFRVLIAGGGVAGLEALLALDDLAGDRVEITLLSADDEFHYRPLSVVEPFTLTQPRTFSLRTIAVEHGAKFRAGELAQIDEQADRVTTSAGSEIDYDALLIAIGAQPVNAVAGTMLFRGSPDAERLRGLVNEVERGGIKRIAFAIPDATWWPVAGYELALLTSAHLRERELEGIEIHLVTSEPRPLGLFGDRASEKVASLLADAGVEVHLNSVSVRFQDGRLAISGRKALACDRVVALPIPYVPPIPGLQGQGERGLITTDRFCRVIGTERIFAAGDATWFPIKQGGLATQQADSAASAIAALAGAPVDPRPFQPILRGALLTGDAPRYMRAAPQAGRESTIARSVLWWPPSKIAGKFLAPYLATKAGHTHTKRTLTDLDPPYEDDAAQAASDHADVVDLAFTSADAAARWHDYRGAMRWLEVAEDLDLFLPPDYEVKRISWQELANRR